MSCDLITKGRANKCATEIGGYNAVYFVPTADLDAVAFDPTTKEVTELSGSVKSFFKYLILGETTIDTVRTAGENTGSTATLTTGTITLAVQSQEDANELQNLQTGLYSLVTEKNNGKSKIVGYDTSMLITELTELNGTANADLVGYTIAFTVKSDRLPVFLAGSVRNSPFAGLTTPANYTIVEQ